MRRWLGFFALCLLWSSAWLVDSVWPSFLSPPLQQGVRDVVLAAVLGLAAFRRIAQAGLRKRPWGRLALASVCLLSVPATLAKAVAGVPDVTTSALFGLVPVAVVVMVSYLGPNAEDDTGSGDLLLPALLGMSGVLLLLPFALPDSWHRGGSDALALLAMLVAAAASVSMHRLMRGFAVSEAGVICAAANAAFFPVVLAVSPASSGAALGPRWGAIGVEAARAMVLDLPQFLLLLWLLRDLAPARFAARYLLVPLLTALEGFALMRPQITWRAIAGVGLVIFGSWKLMTGDEREEEPLRMLS
jgi:drug/metabolite transporter (DMT)-like permease